MWIMKSKYKVHGNYGPLYEIVTAGLELESEVELYFSADNNMAEQSRTYVDSMTLQVLIRTASGKGGGRNTETEATARAWHEGLQKLRLFIFYLCCDR